MWRQGDVFIAATDAIPQPAIRQPHCVLAEGEASGHRHRIDQPQSAELYEHQQILYLQVLAESVKVVHDEHRSIRLPRGTYKVWLQREYRPQPLIDTANLLEGHRREKWLPRVPKPDSTRHVRD
jgi:hypothetical protein